LVSGYITQCTDTDSNVLVSGLYDQAISGTGTVYAFIYQPTDVPPAPVVLDTFLKDNLIYILAAGCGTIVLFFVFFYSVQRLLNYRRKLEEEKEKLKRVQADVMEMHEMGGNAGARDDEVAMTSNPLAMQMDDLRKRFDKNEIELEQKRLEQRQQESSERQAHIKQLMEDRERMRQDLEKMRAQLDAAQQTAAPTGISVPTFSNQPMGLAIAPLNNTFSNFMNVSQPQYNQLNSVSSSSVAMPDYTGMASVPPKISALPSFGGASGDFVRITSVPAQDSAQSSGTFDQPNKIPAFQAGGKKKKKDLD
jgi:hypothetical protein